MLVRNGAKFLEIDPKDLERFEAAGFVEFKPKEEKPKGNKPKEPVEPEGDKK